MSCLTGRFATASRDITVGEVLAVEKPIVSHMLPEYMGRPQLKPDSPYKLNIMEDPPFRRIIGWPGLSNFQSLPISYYQKLGHYLHTICFCIHVIVSCLFKFLGKNSTMVPPPLQYSRQLSQQTAVIADRYHAVMTISFHG
jgi:hypothetical protein